LDILLMRATIDIAANIAGMSFWISWRQHYPNPTPIAITVRAVQHSPNVRSRSSFHDRPIAAFRIPDRFPNVFVRMIGQVRALVSCLVTRRIIT
jgi:hypothetical protein